MLLPSHNFNLLPRDDKGLSLLEIVVAVAIIAVFAVVGILGFQKFTDNARQAAVDTVASDTFTMAMAIDAGLVKSQDGSSTSIHASLVQVNTPSTDASTLAELQEEVNKENTEIRVSIVKDQQDITVTAYGWEDRYVAVKSTINEYDGMKTPPPFEDNDTENDDNSEDGDEQEDTSYTGNIEDYRDGIFEFTVSAPSQLYVYNLSSNATLTDENGKTIEIIETSDGTSLPQAGTYTLRGGFEKIGRFSNLLTSYSREDRVNGKFVSVSKWDNTGTIDASGLFSYSRDLENIVTPPATLQNVRHMFYRAESFNGDVSDWDVSNVTQMDSMFNRAAAFNGDVSNWDVSNVTQMDSMFEQAAAFNGDVSNWDVSNVRNMSHMFYAAYAFNQDVSNWDTSSVTNMSNMFRGVTTFNSDVSNWDTSSVTDMSYMFFNAYAFNQDISKWNVSKVVDMSYTFYGAAIFNSDVSNWDTSSVRNMDSMFKRAAAFNQDISKWDVSDVTNMRSMFHDTNAFNQDISKWDVSKVEDMRQMFEGATVFNQDLSSWKVPNIGSQPVDFVDDLSHPEFRDNTAKHPQWGVS